jgi:hypothetical protein
MNDGSPGTDAGRLVSNGSRDRSLSGQEQHPILRTVRVTSIQSSIKESSSICITNGRPLRTA